MTKIFETRVCRACGLRYPLEAGRPFEARCPLCLGGTRVARLRELPEESDAPVPLPPRHRAVIVENVRSAWNVGSILRSAEGLGFGRAYLCGITPAPEQDAVKKTALGAEKFVKWSSHKDALKLVVGLKKRGWRIFALEEDPRAERVAPVALDFPFALILGNEVAGVDPDLLDLSDRIFYIPMRGKKRSFNVANAFSIAAYALTSQQFGDQR